VLNGHIPIGVTEGQRIRLRKQGKLGLLGNEEGCDLYLEVEFRQHPIYRVEEKDLYLDLPMAPLEAALGAKVKTPTPGGVVDLKIPPSSVSGSKLRLRGRGLPDHPAGDLYVVLQITLPLADSQKAKELYLRMEQELLFNPRAGLGV
jgi:curved DNA-binding protein